MTDHQKTGLELQALYVWSGAKSGREFARSTDPDTRLRALVRAQALSRFQNDKFSSISRIATNAVCDINRMLENPPKAMVQ